MTNRSAPNSGTAWLAMASLGLPGLTILVALSTILEESSWNAIGLSVLATLVALALGAIAAVASLVRRERWSALAWLGFTLNAVPLLWVASLYLSAMLHS